MDDTGTAMQGAEDVAELLTALAPRDVLDAMLAVQMAAVHAAALRATRRAAECTEQPQIEALYLRQAARLMHLFTRQMEALDRRRIAAEERAKQDAREAYFLDKEQREEEERQQKEDEHLKRWGIRPRRRSVRPGGRGNAKPRTRNGTAAPPAPG